MERNYYELLEIDKKASQEIIKKAYTTLVKKYHPDLQSGDLKHIYEEKIKLINEAYDILSDIEKRKLYDEQLERIENQNDIINDELLQENMNLKNELNNLRNNSSHYTYSSTNNSNYKNKIDFEREVENARRKAYYDAYIQDLKNRGYKIRYKKTPKDYFKNFIALLLTSLLLLLIYQIPFVKNFFIETYENNPLLKYIVDIFIKAFIKSS